MPLALAAHPIRDGENQHGDREGKQDRHYPAELHAVGLPIDVGEPFQRTRAMSNPNRSSAAHLLA